MGSVPILQPINRSGESASQGDEVHWVTVAASSSLIASGLLLLAGQRRAALVAAASGTALALLEQQDTLRTLWKQVPGYVEQAQEMIGKVQDAVGDLASRRESLRSALGGTDATEPTAEPVTVEAEEKADGAAGESAAKAEADGQMPN